MNNTYSEWYDLVQLPGIKVLKQIIKKPFLAHLDYLSNKKSNLKKNIHCPITRRVIIIHTQKTKGHFF